VQLSHPVTDKVAVVTGAAKGIGAALAIGLAQDGAIVFAVDADEGGEDVARAIVADGGHAYFRVVDVSDEGSVASLAADVEGSYGRVDILVNNAALDGKPLPHSVIDADPEEFDRTFAVNVKGMWLMVRALLPLMEAAGGASVVNLGSIASFVGYPGIAPYVSSKSGVIGLTRSLSRELGPKEIRVNTLVPGMIATKRLLEDQTAETISGLVATQSLGRLQRPEDLVDPLLFLVSEASRFMTGQTLVVDGGFVFA
jgi:NAD(P)-dependent dehydrogenase (short-subunit alcohol dehydrogenase family)